MCLARQPEGCLLPGCWPTGADRPLCLSLPGNRGLRENTGLVFGDGRFSRHFFHGCFPLPVDLLRQKFGLGAATATGAFQKLLQGRRRGQ
eukprot:3134702-Amphidinium_carterae.1